MVHNAKTSHFIFFYQHDNLIYYIETRKKYKIWVNVVHKSNKTIHIVRYFMFEIYIFLNKLSQTKKAFWVAFWVRFRKLIFIRSKCITQKNLEKGKSWKVEKSVIMLYISAKRYKNTLRQKVRWV